MILMNVWDIEHLTLDVVGNMHRRCHYRLVTMLIDQCGDAAVTGEKNTYKMDFINSKDFLTYCRLYIHVYHQSLGM